MPALPHDAATTLLHAWIEPARTSDADELSALTHRSKAHWAYTADQMASWASELTITTAYLESNAVYLVRRPMHWESKDSPAILGYYAYAPTRDDTVLLDNLFVDPLAMQFGLGRRLLEDFILATRQAAYRNAQVVSDPNAAGFYLHFGFRPLAGENGWQASGPERKLPVMQRPLMPVPGTLDGERVQLVPAVPADARRMHEWLEHATAITSAQRKTVALEAFAPTWESFRDMTAQACSQETNQPDCRSYILEHEHAPVGQISFFQLPDELHPDEAPTALLHCWMADLRLTRRGYGTDAIRTLCSYLHHQQGVSRFVLAWPQEHEAALRMAHNLGFREAPIKLPARMASPASVTMTSAWPLTSF